MISSQLERELKRSVPPRFKDLYRDVARVLSASVVLFRAREIELERTFIGGYNAFTAGDWADLVGEP